MNKELHDIADAINELKEDTMVPKNIKTKLDEILAIFENKDENISIKINKALNTLDELSDDPNIQAFTRTQLWNIATMLESINSNGNGN